MYLTERGLSSKRTPLTPTLQAGLSRTCFLFCIIAGLASAQVSGSDKPDANIAAQLQELQSKAGKFPSFSVKFEQQVYSALRKKTNRSEGELAFAKPKKFRWEISKPNKELYVNNGEWFWKYVERTKHALRLPSNSGELEFLDVIFQLDKLSSKYSIKAVTGIADVDGNNSIKCPADHACIDLEPVQQGSQKNISLAIDRRNGFVSTVGIVFRNGNRTLIRFSSFSGRKISADEFEFTPPAGTAVDKR